MLKRMFDAVTPLAEKRGVVAGMVVPHAGYIYSGPVAASAYAHLKKGDYDTLILLGTSHRYHFDTVSLYAGKSVKTPFGNLPIDRECAEILLKSGAGIEFSPKVHEQEHTLEAHYPFLYYQLGAVPIVPLLFGNNDNALILEIFSHVTKLLQQTKKRVLLVASTDLSHYHSYEEAQKLDRASVDAIRQCDDAKLITSELCGLPSVRLFCKLMREGKSEGVVVDERNSGDVRPESRSAGVVGYASLIFYEK